MVVSPALPRLTPLFLYIPRCLTMKLVFSNTPTISEGFIQIRGFFHVSIRFQRQSDRISPLEKACLSSLWPWKKAVVREQSVSENGVGSVALFRKYPPPVKLSLSLIMDHILTHFHVLHHIQKSLNLKLHWSYCSFYGSTEGKINKISTFSKGERDS